MNKRKIVITKIGNILPIHEMELKLKTDIGELTAVFVSDILDHKTVWTAWIREYPGVITQSDNIQEALDKLPGILDLMLEVEIEQLMK